VGLPEFTCCDERWRITLQLPENNATVRLIESATSRLREQLLRQLITTGYAGCPATTNLPVQPGTLTALMSLLPEVTADTHTAAVREDVPVADAGGEHIIRNNMKKLF